MNKKLRPYVAIDLETTGLDPKSNILELAAILDDGVSPLNELRSINLLVKNPVVTHGEPYALALNADILVEINEGTDVSEGGRVTSVITALTALADMIYTCRELCQEWDEGIRKIKPGSYCSVQLAGKNIAGFDLPLIKSNLKSLLTSSECEMDTVYELMDIYSQDRSKKSPIAHRVIDAGNLLFHAYGYVPESRELNEYIGYEDPTVVHRALNDSVAVVKAVRKSLGVPFDGI
jgi:hypothetical protein